MMGIGGKGVEVCGVTANSEPAGGDGGGWGATGGKGYFSYSPGGSPVHGGSVYNATGPLEVIITPASDGNVNVKVIWRGE